MTENQNAILLLLFILEGKNNSYNIAELLQESNEQILQESHALEKAKYLSIANTSLTLSPKGNRHYTKQNLQRLNEFLPNALFVQLLIPTESEKYRQSVDLGIKEVTNLLNKGKALAGTTYLEILLFSIQRNTPPKNDLFQIKTYINTIISLYSLTLYLRQHIETATHIVQETILLAEKIQDKRSVILLESWIGCGELYQPKIKFFNTDKRLSKSIEMFTELNDPELTFHLVFFITTLHFVSGEFSQLITFHKKMRYVKIPENFIYISHLIDVLVSISANYIGDYPQSLGLTKYVVKKTKQLNHVYSHLFLSQHYCTVLCYMERFEEGLAHSEELLDKLSIHEHPKLYLYCHSMIAFSLYKLGDEKKAFESMDVIFSFIHEGYNPILLPSNSQYFLEILYHYSYHKKSRLVRKQTISILMNFLKSPSQYHVGHAKRIIALNLQRRKKSPQRILYKIEESIAAFASVPSPFEKTKSELLKAKVLEEFNYKQANSKKNQLQKKYHSFKNVSYHEEATDATDIHLINKTHKMLSELPPWRNIKDVANQIAYIACDLLKSERLIIFEKKSADYEIKTSYNFDIHDKNEIDTIKQLINTQCSDKSFFYSLDSNFFISILPITQEKKEQNFKLSKLLHSFNEKKQKNINELYEMFYHFNENWKKNYKISNEWIIYADGEYRLQNFAHPHSVRIINQLLATHIYTAYCAVTSDKAEEQHNTVEEKETTILSPILTTHSAKFQECLNQINMVAESASTVLLLGETGVGKEILARHIHKQSKRKGAFIAVNPVSISETLFESEFFGHEKGAFTGASFQKKGFFELAHEGTLFIDEVGDIPLSMQVKLLRILEERTFMRVGGIKEIHSTFRLITATNIPLNKMIDEGLFRTDFFYRLSTFPINIPPLRERLNDLEILVQGMVLSLAKSLRKEVAVPDAQEVEKLKNYYWPGNLRELKNIIERAIILHSHGPLELSSFIPQNIKVEADICEETPYIPNKIFDSYPSMKDLQEQYFRSILEKTNGKILGKDSLESILQMKKSTIYCKLKEYNIAKKYR